MLTNDDPVAPPPGDVPVPEMNGDPYSKFPGSEMPLLLAAELQDHLMTATNDLERLQRLLDHACEVLMGGFHGAAAQLGDAIDGGHELSPHLQETLKTLYQAVTALQFQDMATQLIAHTNKRLRNCADQIARDALGDDDPDGAAVVEDGPMKPNPVTQDEVDAGSVELF
ncbi:hypothetical protein [Aquabacterium sp.]|uniref:hypothetical protein n=1 Tax=Aquabacterium sp. TaxID=1872578 RepID=UPI002E31C031|nr:hypothetical protein [Aquabacterium sp.]HEX5310398.1 hypothetical protein [Aquabacterium sp.]